MSRTCTCVSVGAIVLLPRSGHEGRSGTLEMLIGAIRTVFKEIEGGQLYSF